MIAAAADPGESSAWAACAFTPGDRPRLLILHPVHGDEHLWWRRALEGARLIVDAYGQVPCRIEVPPATVHRGAGIASHGAGHGLGMRAGLLRAAWWQATPGGVLPQTWSPREWWGPFRLGKKRAVVGQPLGWHRVAEAGMYVDGAAEVLALVTASRRVDCAEAILMAASLAVLS